MYNKLLAMGYSGGLIIPLLISLPFTNSYPIDNTALVRYNPPTQWDTAVQPKIVQTTSNGSAVVLMKNNMVPYVCGVSPYLFWSHRPCQYYAICMNGGFRINVECETDKNCAAVNPETVCVKKVCCTIPKIFDNRTALPPPPTNIEAQIARDSNGEVPNLPAIIIPLTNASNNKKNLSGGTELFINLMLSLALIFFRFHFSN